MRCPWRSLVPSILPDSVATLPETPVTIHVLANDTGAGLKITSFSNPSHGSLVFNQDDQSFTYTPDPGFAGGDSFIYTARDAEGSAASADVSIAVTTGDGVPIVTDDYVEMSSGGEVIIPVLANDIDPSGGALKLSAISMPAHGTVNVLEDQSVRYRPQTGFIGIDGFIYSVVDEHGTRADGAVTVNVLAVNHPPEAVGEEVTVEADQTTTLDVLANDSDPDGDPIRLVGFTMPEHGDLSLNADNSFDYTPAEGYLGPDQFTYTIRDSNGATATAEVRLEVARTNQPPVAEDDHVTTEAGTPVVIDVLANDSDPDGDPLSIEAIGLPVHGRLAFNADGTFTYTPDSGFAGIDDFTYTVGDGRGGTATATAVIEVVASTEVSVYANGYAYRRRLAVPAEAARGSAHTGFPLWVTLAEDWLRSTAHGGRVASDAGHDIRFELEDGTKLAHEIDDYDPAAGRLGAWVRLPELHADQPTVVLLYYGKDGLTEGEADPVPVWQDYLAVWHLPEAGALAASGTVESDASGLGAGSLRVDGNGVLVLDDASWLDGLDALSVQLWSKAASVGHDHGQLNVGDFGSDGASSLGVRYQAVGYADGDPSRVMHCKIATNGRTAFVSSSADIQTTDWQSIALTWHGEDERPRLYLDGREDEPTHTSEVIGPVQTTVTGPLYIGAGPFDSPDGGWQGLIDEVRFRAAKLDAAWIEAEHINQSDPARFYGMGAEETLDSGGDSLVAVPMEAGTPAGEKIDFDVLAAAVLPADSAGATIKSVSQPANGNASVIDNKVRYSPAGDFVGSDSFTYKLAADGHTSTALITVEVGATASTSQDDLPSPRRTIEVASTAELNSALAAAEPGDHIVLADGSYGAPDPITRAGTASDAIVVRAANLLGARVTSGLSRVDADHVIVYGLDFVGESIWFGDGGRASTCKLWRCRFRDQTNSPDGIAVRLFNAPDFDYAFCTVQNWAGRGLAFSISHGTVRPRVRYCLFQDTPDGYRSGDGEALHWSFGQPYDEADGLIYRCKFKNWNGDAEIVSVKCSKNVIRQCSVENCNGALNNRFGGSNLFDACWTKNSWGVGVHDGFDNSGQNMHNRVLGCRVEGAPGGQGLMARAGNQPPGSGAPGHSAAGEAVFSGCDGPIIVGRAFSGHDSPARNTRIRQHTGSITLATETGTDSQPGSAESLYEWSPLLWLEDSDVGPFARL